MLRTLLVAVLTLALLASPAFAGSSSKGGLSKGGGSKSSSKGFSASKSKSDKGSSSARSPKSGGSKGGSGATIVPGVGAVERSAPVHDDGSAAADVRVRGGYLSEANFAALPCEREEVPVGKRTCWRCGDAWFEKLVYDGRPLYVDVYAPEGAQIDRLPERAQEIRGESTTFFATDAALYAPSRDASGGYVVVETAPGFRVEELPDVARVGAPIVSDGETYHRYLGVYYREVHEDDRTYYVASESPF